MTQEEIVKALRNSCHDCNPTPCCEYEVLGIEAADLIETLTARAERAEAELKEAISQMRGVHDHCAHCAFCECNTDDEPCCSCANASNWEWRGAREGTK